MSAKRQSRIRLLIFIGTVVLLLACQAMQPTSVPDPPPADTAHPTQIQAQTSEPPATDSGTQPEVPTIFRSPSTKSSAPGIACLGTSESGVQCTEKNEWIEYSKDRGNLASDAIVDSAVCPDGRLMVLYTEGISIYADGVWEEIASDWETSIPYAIACGPDGAAWVTYFRGAARFDKGRWTTYSADHDFGGKVSDLVYDVAVAPSGDVWIVASDSVARLRDGKWIVYQEGRGFDDYCSFARITIAPDGRPWVAGSWKAHVFDGEKWHTYDNDDIYSAQALAVDDRGRTWVGTVNNGIFVLEGETWRTYTTANSALSSNKIRAIEVDGQGRVWVATEWGLNIFDDNEWFVYRVDNSGMVDHDLLSLAVVDGGPSFSRVDKKNAGTLFGRVVDTVGTPLSGITVELCVEKLSSSATSDPDVTPCSGQPFSRTVKTTDDGQFTFELPPGYYHVAVQYGPGWVLLANRYGFVSRRHFVQENQTTYTGEVILGAQE